MSVRVLKMSEIRSHCTSKSLWIVLGDKVWDLTSFAHPGGEKILLRCGGKVATDAFWKTHPKDLADRLLSKSQCVGVVDTSTVRSSDIARIEDVYLKKKKKKSKKSEAKKPSLSEMLNVYDFESVARRVMDKEGWGYYSSGADDEITLRENHTAFQRIWLKPRVLVDVSSIDTSTRILGRYADLPLYFTATALGKLAHPDGELAITRAAGHSKVPYMLPTLSSYTLREMLDAKISSDQTQFGQLYVNADRAKSFEYVRELERGGCRGLFVTVDAPQLGRREKDMRNKFESQGTDVQNEDEVNRDEGVTRAISSYIDPSLSWSDIEAFRSMTKMPIVLKGVQCAEDAVLAYHAGCTGVVLSNHGGRQLDTARSGIEILEDVVQALDRQLGRDRWRGHFELYVATLLTRPFF